MLIALERRRQRAWAVYRRLRERKAVVTIPTPVLGEWWRGTTDLREALCLSAHLQPLTDTIARLAGDALAAVPGAGTIDAFVMSTASLRGDIVFTSDFDDLQRLRRFFPGVRVLAV
jgi:predicted nucleic acid-binding protein